MFPQDKKSTGLTPRQTICLPACHVQKKTQTFASLSLKREQETDMAEANTCGCGRSPTGKCCGWHNLSEEQYAEKKAQWEARQAEKKAS